MSETNATNIYIVIAGAVCYAVAMAKDKERTSLRLEPETMAMIKAVAAVTGVDMGTVVDRAIPAFVETLDEKNRRLVRDVVKSALAARSGAK